MCKMDSGEPSPTVPYKMPRLPERKQGKYTKTGGPKAACCCILFNEEGPAVSRQDPGGEVPSACRP